MDRREELRQFNEALIEEFRANGGRVDGWDIPLLLLTTTGARSGQPRVSPLTYTLDGERLIILAADLGAAQNPGWYHNIVAQPEVSIELGSERWQTRAIIATGEERERLFKQHTDQLPGVLEYQARCARPIPVVILPRKAE